MKIITYKMRTAAGKLTDCEIRVPEDILEDNLAIVKGEAWNGSYDVQEAEESVTRQIAALKTKLLETDYHILKIVEGAATIAECAEVISQRAAWRKKIKKLEQEVVANEKTD